MRPSSRLPRESAPNALSRALDALRRDGTSYVDLTESNPTRAGIAYPEDLLAPLSLPAALHYEPHPLGLAAARQAVATDCGRRGARVDPAHVVLSASTSEMYAWLFKLLCDAGESVVVPRPSYPLFEHLTRLEGVRAEARCFYGDCPEDGTRDFSPPEKKLPSQPRSHPCRVGHEGNHPP